MITDYVADRMVTELKKYFHKYSFSRVSPHLEKVNLPPTYILDSYKTFLGFKYNKKYNIIQREIDFTAQITFDRSFRNIFHGFVLEKYIIMCAIDEENKEVYWKAEFVSRNLEHEWWG